MAMSKMEASFGGLHIGNFKKINSNLCCERCRLLLLDPKQLLCCGVRLCHWCSKKGLPDSKPFICPFCHVKQEKKQVQTDRGAQRELDKTDLQCYACSWNGLYPEYLKHLEKHHAISECPDCHERFFAINLYEEHREEICKHRLVSCPIPGCEELVKLPEMRRHCLSRNHQICLIAFVVDYISRQKCSATSSDIVLKRRGELLAINEAVHSLLHTILIPIEDCERLKRERNQINSKTNSSIEQINEMKKLFNKGHETCVYCIQSQDEAMKDLENTKILVSKTNLLLDMYGSRIFMFQLDIHNMNLPFSFDSPMFRTSTFGYVFKIRVCSTHDKQDYLSIYLTLYSSAYDPILVYPFPYNVSLYLCDQSGERRDIETMIKADRHTSELARPTGEKNDEIGVTQFCPLNHLTKTDSIYVKDGVFFIRILFHFLDSPSVPIT